MSTDTREYLSCADTAKLVRHALKGRFPTVKFSVRSSVYSGGASIDISWMDGPVSRRVEAIARQFEGADFDGMVDLKTYRSHYLAPNGKPVLASAHPNGMSSAEHFAPPDVSEVRQVHFGADFIFCRRRLSEEQRLVEEAHAYILAHCIIEGTGAGARFGNDYVDNLARNMAYSRDFETPNTLEDAFDLAKYGRR